MVDKMYTEESSTPTSTTFTYVDVGNSFISAYYKTLTTDINTLYNFYEENAAVIRIDEEIDTDSNITDNNSIQWSSRTPITGQLQIHKISQLIGQCKCKIDTVDYVPSSADGSILILVTGVILLDTVYRAFAQSFLLVATTDTSYAIRNDILRFLRNDSNNVTAPVSHNTTVDHIDTAAQNTENHVTAEQNNEIKVLTDRHAIDETGDEIKSAKSVKSNKSIKSPQPTKSTASVEPTLITEAIVTKSTGPDTNVNGVTPATEPTHELQAAAAEATTQNTTSNDNTATTKATTTKSTDTQKQTSKPVKASTWAALVKPTTTNNNNTSTDATVTPAVQQSNKQTKPTITTPNVSTDADTTESKQSEQPTTPTKRVDNRAYKPTGFWGKPSAEQVASSIVVNNVPDSITHDTLRNACVQQFGRVRHLHQPQNKKFIVVYFIDMNVVEKALSVGSVTVNNTKLSVVKNTYKPNLDNKSVNKQEGEKTNFAPRGRGFNLPTSVRGKSNNKPNGITHE